MVIINYDAWKSYGFEFVIVIYAIISEFFASNYFRKQGHLKYAQFSVSMPGCIKSISNVEELKHSFFFGMRLSQLDLCVCCVIRVSLCV